MKKLLAIIFAFAMLLNFAACDDKETKDEEKNGANKSSSDDISEASAALQKYYDSQVDLDVDTYIELMPEYAQEEYIQKGRKVKKEIERYLRDMQDYFNTVFGKNTSIEVEVTSSEELSQDELDKATDKYKNVGIDDCVIEKGVKLTYNVTKSGDISVRSVTATAVIIVEDGDWKVMDILED